MQALGCTATNRPGLQARLISLHLQHLHVQAATSAMNGALRRTWLHPLLKRLLPKQGQVGRLPTGWRSQHAVGSPRCCHTHTRSIMPSFRSNPFCPPACHQGPSRADMLGGFFKMRVLGWASEEGSVKAGGYGSGQTAEPLVVQVCNSTCHRCAGW